ncbi:MAG: hypothetical protein ACRDLT_11355 [Solirubrobacteraceae bacterium]
MKQRIPSWHALAAVAVLVCTAVAVLRSRRSRPSYDTPLPEIREPVHA